MIIDWNSYSALNQYQALKGFGMALDWIFSGDPVYFSRVMTGITTGEIRVDIAKDDAITNIEEDIETIID